MSNAVIAGAIRAVERVPLPDGVLRIAISRLVGTRRSMLQASPDQELAFAREMQARPIAVHTDKANDQHYELPPEFFALSLGPHRKYSCCHYDRPDATLAEAEASALEITAQRAGLADGQSILELGCGWGSMTLWMAAAYPNARITAVSNSHGQRRFIEGEARRRGLANVRIVTADVKDLQLDGQFDRVLSIEMFEHMSNWAALLRRVHEVLEPDGRLFVHVFAHRAESYAFDHHDQTDWIGQHFFTGGIMPGEGLMRQFPDLFEVADEWRWSGRHYARTARHWLENYDRNAKKIAPILKQVYGEDWALWQRRWRLFFLAVEGLFGFEDGERWGVKHYLMRPVETQKSAA
ncbi:MAG: class I SAM-dependent methyltransferase [Hyphomicrobiaceae bacterium]|nr:class I SAM-dependent methyltransferase [Hyphomicrobiaceae bacterium]